MVDWKNFLDLFILGSMGAFSVEILKLYELKGKLHYKKYSVIYKSILFWVVSLLFIIVSGFLTWAMNENNPNVTVWQLVFTGMGMSAITKKIGEAFASREKLNAGDSTLDINLRDLF